MKRKLTSEQANVIMKAALVALIETNKERRRAYGLPRTMDTEDIRAVFQCLPEFNTEYSEARRVITDAASQLATPRATEGLTVEACLAELRRLVEGRAFVNSSAAYADYGDGFKEHVEHHVIVPGRRFQGSTLDEAMQEVRAWAESRAEKDS